MKAIKIAIWRGSIGFSGSTRLFLLIRVSGFKPYVWPLEWKLLNSLVT